MQPSWTDRTQWNALLDGSTCPFCVDGPQGVIAELEAVRVTMDRAVNVRGYCCLVLKQHAVELHALPQDDATRFMDDVQTVAAAVQRVTGAIKLNYEIHGNVVPHIHMHIVPRYPGDAIEVTGLPFARLTESPYSNAEFERLRIEITEALANR